MFVFVLQIEVELKRIADVCELLPLCEIARDFLLLTGGNPEQPLFERLHQLRLLPDFDCRSLRNIKLAQVDDFVCTLRLARAAQMTLFGQDPFMLAPDTLREPVPRKGKGDVVTSLTKRVRPEQLLTGMLRFIDECLLPQCLSDQDRQFNPDGQMRDYLYAFLDGEESEELATNMAEVLQDFPEVLVKHAISLFTALVRRIRGHESLK